MVRKLVYATVSAALCLGSVSPAFAENYQSQIFNAPRGANATANIRLSFGGRSEPKPTYGLSFGVGKDMGARQNGQVVTRQLQLADIRFNSQGTLKHANFASFDIAHLDQDKRLNLSGGDSTWLWVAGGVALGVGICWAAGCFDGDDDNDDE
jgi:hypothetical protein